MAWYFMGNKLRFFFLQLWKWHARYFPEVCSARGHYLRGRQDDREEGSRTVKANYYWNKILDKKRKNKQKTPEMPVVCFWTGTEDRIKSGNSHALWRNPCMGCGRAIKQAIEVTMWETGSHRNRSDYLVECCDVKDNICRETCLQNLENEKKKTKPNNTVISGKREKVPKA